MRASLQVGKLIGIPIKLHFTFLFILLLIVLMFAQAPGPIGLQGIEGLSDPFRYFFSVIAALAFFVSLLLHELSHSFVAMKYGSKIHSITLFFFGGLAMMDDIPKDPEKELRIAIAGPMMSFALGAVFFIAFIAFYGLTEFSSAIHCMPKIYFTTADYYCPLNIGALGVLVFSLGFINTLLAFFNLIPAFPMDGGRVLRAILAGRMSFLKATKKAVLVGKIFAVIMGITGLTPFFFNPWLTIIAIILYIAATEEETATVTFAALEGIKVKNVMRIERTCVLEDMPIAELASKMLEEKTAEYAVVNWNDDLKGFVTFEELKKLSAEQRLYLKVSEVVSPFNEIDDTILDEEEATQALKKMIRAKKNILAVKREESGNFVGIITKRDLEIYIEMLKGRV